MFSKSSLRGTALLIAAGMLAACGSDKAAGPVPPDNDQIIAEMTAALDSLANDGTATLEQAMGLEFAIVGLSVGAPVSSGNVTIDGTSYPFSTTALSIEGQDSTGSDVVNGTLVIGWRKTNGDSLFLAAYSPYDTLGSGSLPFFAQPRSGTLGVAEISRMLRSGSITVSRASDPVAYVPQFFALVADGKVFGSSEEADLVSGSISTSDLAGECDLAGLDASGMSDMFTGCSLQRSNIALQANTWAADSGAGVPSAGPEITIPAQSVDGVKVVAQVTTAPPPV